MMVFPWAIGCVEVGSFRQHYRPSDCHILPYIMSFCGILTEGEAGPQGYSNVRLEENP